MLQFFPDQRTILLEALILRRMLEGRFGHFQSAGEIAGVIVPQGRQIIGGAAPGVPFAEIAPGPFLDAEGRPGQVDHPWPVALFAQKGGQIQPGLPQPGGLTDAAEIPAPGLLPLAFAQACLGEIPH